MTVEVTTQACNLPPFKSQVTPQDPPTANSIELLRDEIERYLQLLKDGTCADLTSLGARVEECCQGGGGTEDPVARAAAAAAQSTANTALANAAAAQAEIDAYTDIVAGAVAIGTWLGVTRYRKVITIAAGPNGGTDNHAHGITTVTKVIRQIGYLWRTSTGDGAPLPYVHATVPIQMNISGANLQLTSAGNFSAFAGEVELIFEGTP